MAKRKHFDIAFNFLSVDKRVHWPDLDTSGFFLMMLICGLFERLEVVSQYDVVKENEKFSAPFTYKIVSSLVRKGYLSKQRSNQYFSRSYLTLTDKGNLFKSKLYSLLNKNL